MTDGPAFIVPCRRLELGGGVPSRFSTRVKQLKRPRSGDGEGIEPVGKCRVGEPGLQPKGILRHSGRPRAHTRRDVPLFRQALRPSPLTPHRAPVTHDYRTLTEFHLLSRGKNAETESVEYCPAGKSNRASSSSPPAPSDSGRVGNIRAIASAAPAPAGAPVPPAQPAQRGHDLPGLSIARRLDLANGTR